MLAIMKLRAAFFAVFMIATCLARPGFAAEVFYVVRLTDAFSESEVRVLASEEYRTLTRRINAERFLHTRAVRKSEDEWEERYPGHPYPGAQLKKRTIRSLHRTTSMEKAQEKIETMEQFSVSRHHTDRSGSRGRDHLERRGGGDRYEERKRHREEQRKREAKEEEALLARVFNIYAETLNKLVSERYSDLGGALEPVAETGSLPAVREESGRDIRRIGESSPGGLSRPGSIKRIGE